MERSLDGLPRSKWKWKEYLKTRCDQEWKIRWERWPCPFQGEAGACMVIFFGGWGDCDSERLIFLPADFKRWWRFCLACRLLPRLVYLSALIGFNFVLVLLFLSSYSFFLLKVKVKVAQSSLTLCNPMDYTVHGILQARILDWVAFHFSRGSSQPRDQTQVSCIAGGFFTSWTTREALLLIEVNASCAHLSSKVFHFEVKVGSLHWKLSCLFPVGNLEGGNLHWCGT